MNQFLTLTNIFMVFDVISYIILIAAAFNYLKNNTKVNLEFSFGSVKVKRKDINSSNLTNIVSQYFFNGGTVPDKIRAEIMTKTNPKNYGIEFKDNSTDAQKLSMMEKVTKDFLAGSWTHEEWTCELTMFNFLLIEWPLKIRGYGSWKLRGNEVILTYVHEGTRDRMFYIFSVEEIVDENTIKTKDVESNKIEILRRC